jgi:glycopeptide antibiotics resistance protein
MLNTNALYKTAFMAYLLFLLWLVLFKLSADPISVLAHYQYRSLNLIPFAGYSPGTLREMIDNFVVFVPFGVLLSVNFKHIGRRRKLVYIFGFSVAAEIAQYIFAIGTTDITDVLTNTLGGLLGLAVYGLASKYIHDEKLDRFIAATMIILLVALTLLRLVVFNVRY